MHLRRRRCHHGESILALKVRAGDNVREGEGMKDEEKAMEIEKEKQNDKERFPFIVTHT